MDAVKLPLAVLIAAFLCLLSSVAATKLSWSLTNNEAALCNDFTQAGFFHRNVTGEERKWVIFLEGGVLCYSNDTCNRRYFQSHIRNAYSTSERTQSPFGNFDTAEAWEDVMNRPLTNVVNPLVTSLYCFENETRYFEDTKSLEIVGMDILSSNCEENPVFCQHGHVLIPYCSSDLWLGDENATSRTYPSLKKKEPCECFDQECFEFNPTSEDLQFTFRGRTIFQSVIQELNEIYNLQEAAEIILVGSSAGGVGVLNLAKWVSEEYPNVRIKAVADSSWFINFQDGINQEFGAATRNMRGDNETSDGNTLLNLVGTQEACNDVRLGYPCCLSAQCLLTQTNPTTGVPYFPRNVSLFTITSLYDIFLLAQSLVQLSLVDSGDITATGIGLQYITRVGEYGGAMDAALIEVATAINSFSYYVTQCFQHIYFAASSLHSANGLLSIEPAQVTRQIASFR